MCNKHGIKTDTGIVDIGVRYELPDEIMKDVNKYMYEAKFCWKSRTILRDKKSKKKNFLPGNPSGFVSAEVYDNNLHIISKWTFI
ncbi:MAG: hypothetical protein V8R26_04945 [Clostridia bacterium]